MLLKVLTLLIEQCGCLCIPDTFSHGSHGVFSSCHVHELPLGIKIQGWF